MVSRSNERYPEQGNFSEKMFGDPVREASMKKG
jgi:hypothetical protein